MVCFSSRAELPPIEPDNRFGQHVFKISTVFRDGNEKFSYAGYGSKINSSKLVVVLVGTGGEPKYYTWLLKFLVDNNVRVIFLAYKNSIPVHSKCRNSMDHGRCYENYRSAVSFGGGVKDLVDVPKSESIEGLLVDVLQRLRNGDASGGWERFLGMGNSVVWKDITLIGYSLGAGHSAYIAKKRKVNRVVLLSGPSDWVDNQGFPTWFKDDSVTAKEDFFAVYQADDPVVSISGNSMQITGGLSLILGCSASTTLADYVGKKNSCRMFEYNECKVDEPGGKHSCLMNPAHKSVWLKVINLK